MDRARERGEAAAQKLQRGRRGGGGAINVETVLLGERDWVPNNPALPVIIYRHVVDATDREEAAQAFEATFRRNGWPPRWRDGIFDYHHYHSTAHEVLGIAAESATVTIGGPGGREIEVAAGDALLLPAGTGHCRVDGSDDFLVIGAYPNGQDFDICREAPSEATRRRIREVPVPSSDPLGGAAGPVIEYWR